MVLISIARDSLGPVQWCRVASKLEGERTHCHYERPHYRRTGIAMSTLYQLLSSQACTTGWHLSNMCQSTVREFEQCLTAGLQLTSCSVTEISDTCDISELRCTSGSDILLKVNSPIRAVHNLEHGGVWQTSPSVLAECLLLLIKLQIPNYQRTCAWFVCRHITLRSNCVSNAPSRRWQ